MTHSIFRAPLLALAVLSLAACGSLGSRKAPAPEEVVEVSGQARQAEAERQAQLRAQPDWTFQGRVAVSKGRDGGNGRIDWQQQDRQYHIQLAAPVTRQSWRLSGDSRQPGARLEGLDGGPRAGDDAQWLLLEATGWDIPVNQLPDWVRGLVAADAPAPERLGSDAEGRPRTLHQLGWDIGFLDWYPAEDGRPALPRRIEATRGDAKVRLIVDQWSFEVP